MTQANHATLSLAWETVLAKAMFSPNGIGRAWTRGDPPGADPAVLAMLDRVRPPISGPCSVKSRIWCSPRSSHS
jgi:hypothetical protein